MSQLIISELTSSSTSYCHIMAPHFVLYEHAAGYALFKLQEFEEVATFLPQVEESVTDVSKFSQVMTRTLESPVISHVHHYRSSA